MSQDEAQFVVEQFDDKLSALLENIDSLVDKKLKPISADVSDIKQDVKVIKQAVKGTNQDLHLLETRVNRLKTA